ncbi:hypothetical protein T09_2622 [Trichinella sp. T9]|nr:hypothetical protein T09_2622 [Trichinella sp. T9]
MAENLHLVLNERVHEGRVYNLKHTNMQDKQWVNRGCRGSIYTNSDVDAVLDCNPYADDCTPDNDILYKMEKKMLSSDGQQRNGKPYRRFTTKKQAKLLVSFQRIKVLERQCTENGHKNFQDFRQLSSSWRFHPTGECRKENLSILSEHSVWSMDGTFKIVPEWYKDLSTRQRWGGPTVENNHPDLCTAGDISGGQHTRLLFPFLPSSSTEGDGSWDANQLHQ